MVMYDSLTLKNLFSNSTVYIYLAEGEITTF